LEPAQGGLASRAHIVRLAIDADESAIGRPDIAELGGEHNPASTILDGFAHQLLVPAHSINVDGIKESDAELDSAVNGSDRLGFLSGSVKIAHAHAAKAQRRHEQSGPT
jgi:hypothetical protein